MAVVNAICKHGKQPAPNPVLLSYYEKKCKNKPAKVALAASMHKLVFIIFAVLRDQKSFELKTPEQHAAEQGFVKAAWSFWETQALKQMQGFICYAQIKNLAAFATLVFCLA